MRFFYAGERYPFHCLTSIPTFIILDLKTKSLRGIISNHAKATPIKRVEMTDSYLILQGDENNRVWSMMVNRDTGKLSASVSGEQYGFLLFGSCTLLPK